MRVESFYPPRQEDFGGLVLGDLASVTGELLTAGIVVTVVVVGVALLVRRRRRDGVQG